MSVSPKADIWRVFLKLSPVQQITVIAMAMALVGFGFAIGKWAGGVESKAQITSLENRLQSREWSTERSIECQATITDPKTGDKVPAAFPIEATISGIPEGSEFVPWIVTTDRENPSYYWPQSVAILGDDGIWRGSVNNLGGKEGKRRSFALLLVGRDGQLLIGSWKEGWVKGRGPLKQLTRDTVNCAEMDVIYTESAQ